MFGDHRRAVAARCHRPRIHLFVNRREPRLGLREFRERREILKNRVGINVGTVAEFREVVAGLIVERRLEHRRVQRAAREFCESRRAAAHQADLQPCAVHDAVRSADRAERTRDRCSAADVENFSTQALLKRRAEIPVVVIFLRRMIEPVLRHGRQGESRAAIDRAERARACRRHRTVNRAACDLVGRDDLHPRMSRKPADVFVVCVGLRFVRETFPVVFEHDDLVVRAGACLVVQKLPKHNRQSVVVI